MVRRILLIGALLAMSIVPGAEARQGCKLAYDAHDLETHKTASRHTRNCRARRSWLLKLSEGGGAGQIAVHGDLAAVLQRDDGIVALVDIASAKPKVLGRYDDGATQSLDGDLEFSDDGEWLFYACQTVQFSRDGIHVLDVSDPAAPAMTAYQAQGGTLRIKYFVVGDVEYIATLDATHGLVINRFERTTGQIAPVFADAAPAQKVGGPDSAGLHFEPSDPMLETPLLYVTTGTTGLQVYDVATPEEASIIGSWADEGLADVEVRTTPSRRTVFAATEYWFDKSTEPRIVQLDATKLDDMKEVDRWGEAPADDLWRIQSLDLAGKHLYVAASHAGVLKLRWSSRGIADKPKGIAANLGSGGNVESPGAPYAFDALVVGKHVLASDGASGTLTRWKFR